MMFTAIIEAQPIQAIRNSKKTYSNENTRNDSDVHLSTHQHGFEDNQQSQYRHNQVANPLQQIIEEFTKVSHSGWFVYKSKAFLLIFGLKHQTFCRFLLIFGHNYVTL